MVKLGAESYGKCKQHEWNQLSNNYHSMNVEQLWDSVVLEVNILTSNNKNKSNDKAEKGFHGMKFLCQIRY